MSYTPGEHCGGSPLSSEQIEKWKTEGVLIIDDLFPQSLIDTIISEINDNYLTFDPNAKQDFGSGGAMEFPTSYSDGVNEITLNERLIRAVEQLLGANSEDIRLTQSDLWRKDGLERFEEYDNQDQRVHVDFLNHNLVVPVSWDYPDNVAAIIYYSDVEISGGATAFVPREGNDDEMYVDHYYQNTPGYGNLLWINNREKAEEYISEKDEHMFEFRAELYRREKKVFFKPGTILFYRYDMWHRGTPLISGAVRYVQNLAFKRAGYDWINNWNPGWSTKMYSRQQTLENLIATASVKQRNILGFPPPGHSFWNEHTLRAVGLRYGPLGMDMDPYSNT